ncbi:hypothetical protein Tco_0745503 [Tanacetum coccineum]
MDSGAKGAQPLKSCLKGSKIRNIEGKILGKDGNPLQPVRKIRSVTEKEGFSLNKEPMFSMMPSINEDETQNLDTNGLAENPNSGLDTNTGGKDDTSGKKDEVAGVQNVWEDPKILPIKNSSAVGVSLKHSFASVVSHDTNLKIVNFRALYNAEKIVDSDFVLPLASIQAVKHKFENSLVGYFVGKSVAFPLVT